MRNTGLRFSLPPWLKWDQSCEGADFPLGTSQEHQSCREGPLVEQYPVKHFVQPTTFEACQKLVGWPQMDRPLVFFFFLFFSHTRLKMSATSSFVSSMSSTIKGTNSFCSIESLFNTNSGKSIGPVKVEPQAEGVCSGEESGIVTEGPGRLVFQAIVGDRGCSLSPTAFLLVLKEPEGLSTLKSFGTKCTLGIRSLGTILGKN